MSLPYAVHIRRNLLSKSRTRTSQDEPTTSRVYMLVWETVGGEGGGGRRGGRRLPFSMAALCQRGSVLQGLFKVGQGFDGISVLKYRLHILNTRRIALKHR